MADTIREARSRGGPQVPPLSDAAGTGAKANAAAALSAREKADAAVEKKA